MLNNKTKLIVEGNRNRLAPIIKTIIFCGHNSLALRGHRDDGALNTETAITGNEGVFRSLLAFRIDSGDHILADHLKLSNKNATMISKTIQNELINVIHQVVVEVIVNNIKNNIYFSILCDETTDNSTKEQMSFSVRYELFYHYLL